MGGHSVTAQKEAKRLLLSADAERAADRFDEAIEKLERALSSEGALESPLVAEIRLRLAECHRRRNDHAASLAVLQPLLTFPLEDEWHGRALALSARAAFYLGDIPRAHEWALQSVELLKKEQNLAELDVAFQILGNVLQNLGQTKEAELAFQRAVVLAELMDARSRAASCRGSIAGLHVSRSDYAAAAEEFRLCQAINTDLGHRSQLARDYMNLAICLFHLGELPDAQESAERALQLFQGMDDKRGLGLTAILLTRIAARQGRAEARSLLDQAVELAAASGFRKLRLMALEERGEEAHRRGDLPEAERLFRNLISLARPEAPDGDAVYETRAKLARVLLERGDLLEAERLSTLSLEAARKAADRRVLGCALTVLAEVQWELGHRESAAARIEEARGIFREIKTPFELAEAEAVAEKLAAEPGQGAAEMDRAEADPAAIGGAPSREATALVAVDPRFRQIVETARNLWQLDGHVVIQGETGTGKEAIARLIHESAPTSGEPFVILNCAALGADGTDDVLANAFREAAGGSLLLDEVDKMPAAVQERLLWAVSGEHARIEGAAGERVRPRILCAAGVNLRQLSEAGGFLPELYHRLAGFVLEIPPLRERPTDIAALTEHFARGVVAPDALELLRCYAWPGNARELKNVVTSAEFMAGPAAVNAAHLPTWVRSSQKPSETLPEHVGDLERRLIRDALQATGGNKVQAAKRLGVSRKGLIDRLKRLGLWDEFGRPRTGGR
ncbi:MAG: hypothetical protein DHS20C21_06960 [Gemmatimonadota bacterium]|nr:MAG: hypothetical protein DHS20C21_06960 [Gemmatimonadota bacterium]